MIVVYVVAVTMLHVHLQVNAKLSDYGIACYATAAGLTQSVGTAGYRAPELLLSTSSNMPYYEQVGIMSCVLPWHHIPVRYYGIMSRVLCPVCCHDIVSCALPWHRSMCVFLWVDV